MHVRINKQNIVENGKYIVMYNYIKYYKYNLLMDYKIYKQ